MGAKLSYIKTGDYVREYREGRVKEIIWRVIETSRDIAIICRTEGNETIKKLVLKTDLVIHYDSDHGRKWKRKEHKGESHSAV